MDLHVAVRAQQQKILEHCIPGIAIYVMDVRRQGSFDPLGAEVKAVHPKVLPGQAVREIQIHSKWLATIASRSA